MIKRLTGQLAFARLRREGRRSTSGAIWVRYVVDTEVDAAHVGYAISKRVGSAVVRNRVRRKLRHLMRALDEIRPQGLLPGFYLIGVDPRVCFFTYDEMRVAVSNCFAAIDRKTQ